MGSEAREEGLESLRMLRWGTLVGGGSGWIGQAELPCRPCSSAAFSAYRCHSTCLSVAVEQRRY